MSHVPQDRPSSAQPLPWYRYPWPWVAIGIPGAAVVGGLFTLYLAVKNPDPLVVDEGRYQELRSELTADPVVVTGDQASDANAGDTHHERERNH